MHTTTRRWFSEKSSAAMGAAVFTVPDGHGHVAAVPCGRRVGTAGPDRTTFAIETYVGRTYNYLDNMVDKDGLPYFNIFWTDPAEAAHDWPDFGDVMSRQLQAAIMARHMTGKEARNEKLWTKKVLSYLDPTDGAARCGPRPPSRSRWPTSATMRLRSTPW